jgi:hypothetical protein
MTKFENLQNLPVGVQSFEKLRKSGYLYLDKTEMIHRLVTTGSCYFLSRPRRFGKSLLLSTIQAYFEGRRDLFEGTAMARLEKEWTARPVLHLDLNLTKYETPDSLMAILNNTLCEWEELYGSRPSETSPELRFRGVVKRAAEQSGQQVAILIDEYDKPMLQTLHNQELQDEYRATLKSFYGVLKSMDAYIKFALLTGVTKFGKVSVFSDLNNLRDISMEDEYATLCGITDCEIDTVLRPYVSRLAAKMNTPEAQVREELRRRYDGYHFMFNSPAIYNPFSVLSAFQANKLGNYWYDTGTPTYLVDMMKLHRYELDGIEHVMSSESAINSVTPNTNSPIPVIYQSGYLTIKDYDEEFHLYTLGFPNKEVEEGFFDYLLPQYSAIPDDQSAFYVMQFVTDVRRGDVNSFMKRLSSLFADTPYELVRDLENHYQNVIFIISKLLGFYVRAEYHTSQGRIDLVLTTDEYIYVMEFKFDGSAEDALHQIEEKHYAQPFASDSRQVIRVGVNFSSQTRNIDGWLIA